MVLSSCPYLEDWTQVMQARRVILTLQPGLQNWLFKNLGFSVFLQQKKLKTSKVQILGFKVFKRIKPIFNLSISHFIFYRS